MYLSILSSASFDVTYLMDSIDSARTTKDTLSAIVTIGDK